LIKLTKSNDHDTLSKCHFFSHRAFSPFGPLSLPLRFSLLLDEKQRETAKEQRARSLFFQPWNGRRSRISADNEISLAVNFREKQQKQRGARLTLPPVQPIPDQAAGD
jgi:hypothetical protein